jgi:hypothetical protein
MYELKIGEVKDAARELRQRCLAGDLTAYDGNGDSIDKMAWLPLEIVLDTENRLWITRNGLPVGDVFFRRDDVLKVWPELPDADDGVNDAGAVAPSSTAPETAIEPAGQDVAEAEQLNAAPGQITVHDALECISRMLCAQLGDEWISELTLKEQWALRPWTNDPSSPIRLLNMADFQPSSELIAHAREKNGWRREQRQRALTWLRNHGLLPATTEYLSPATSTFIDRPAFERVFEAEFGKQYRDCGRSEALRSPRPTEADAPVQPATTASELSQDEDGATPIAPIPNPVSNKGGAPTDKDRVIAEARRRIDAKENLPTTLKKFAEQLQKWLEGQPDAVRRQKTGKVMQVDTIEDHVRPLWTAYRDGVPR